MDVVGLVKKDYKILEVELIFFMDVLAVVS